MGEASNIVKSIKVWICLIMMVAVLLASVSTVSAIGFDAELVYESVFVVYSGNSLGSGFAIGENCIITNAHVIDHVHNITVETYGGIQFRATVLQMDEQLDVAVLIVADAAFVPLPVADVSTMKTGDDIYAIGAPKGMAYTLTKGGISAKERMIGDQSYIQIDAAINEGNSGGPLLNDDGQVLGVNTLKMSDSEGIGLAIPITRVCDYLRSLGLVLDDSGNVAEPVVLPEEVLPPETQPNDDYENNKPDTDRYEEDHATMSSVAVIVATLSLGGNVVLTVLLINEKKKKAAVSYDPSERTDFDIDILE